MAFWGEKHFPVPGAQIALDSCPGKMTRSAFLPRKKGAAAGVVSLETSSSPEGKFPSFPERNQRGRMGVPWKRTQEENA